MTNGEKIKTMFPNAEISIVKSNYGRTKVAVDWKFEQIPSYYNLFYEDWWNAEYKEPTTKNDSGVDYTINSLDDFIELGKKAFGVELTIKALEQEPILEKIYADIQRLRGCSCSCSDGIIDDVEDILDKYKAEMEET